MYTFTLYNFKIILHMSRSSNIYIIFMTGSYYVDLDALELAM